MKDRCLVDSRIFDLVRSESDRQIETWGVQDRSPFEWLAYATEELGEVSQAISELTYRDGTYEDVICEAIQAATLCLKIAEMFLAEAESYDCHGGPGTTVDPCGSCNTCLMREEHRLNQENAKLLSDLKRAVEIGEKYF